MAQAGAPVTSQSTINWKINIGESLAVRQPISKPRQQIFNSAILCMSVCPKLYHFTDSGYDLAPKLKSMCAVYFVSRHNSSNGMHRSVCARDPTAFPNSAKMYLHWTPNVITDINGNGELRHRRRHIYVMPAIGGMQSGHIFSCCWPSAAVGAVPTMRVFAAAKQPINYRTKCLIK